MKCNGSFCDELIVGWLTVNDTLNGAVYQHEINKTLNIHTTMRQLKTVSRNAPIPSLCPARREFHQPGANMPAGDC